NPVIAVTFNKEKRRNTVILPDELPAWWQKVHQLENPVRRDLHIFLLFTGMRRRAATGGRWEHFDPQIGLLVVPNPKGGEDRAFDLPLSEYLIDLLKRRYEGNQVAFEGSPWIWPADSKSGHVAEPKEPKRGLPSPHCLRHSYASFAKAAGLGQLDIALLMNHKLPGVTGGYIHEAALMEHLKMCQEKITNHLLGLVGN
ncbi:MAG: tyrosine-type recombinase/integrase, partial [Nitrospirota bacterium]|nr:tyrosine-type recombinase/integrase [Nitrospirota bacterium]